MISAPEAPSRPESSLAPSEPASDVDRRSEARTPAIGAVWLIDNETSALLSARCVDMSRNGLRLRAPVGYGLRPGRHYELCSHRPGQSAPPGLGFMLSRGGTVVRAEVVVAGDGADVEVGVALDADRRPRYWEDAARPECD